jgi:hypothetical protein
MSDDSMMFDPNGRNDDVTRGLRVMYAAPEAEGYWDGLESRIMRYILTADGGPWWTAFGGWTRAGAVAAAIAIIAVGLGTRGAREAELRAAYQAIDDDAMPASTFERISRTPGLSKSEAVLQYVVIDRN